MNQDTDRTKAIVITHISHSWLKQVDEAIGAMQACGTGNFDLFASLNALGYPVISRLTAQFRARRKRTND